MPRSASEDIYTLIQSLSKAEKRYFKLYASLGVSSPAASYLQLFDAIERQKKYDEPRIVRKFKGVSPLQFANRKKHLYGLILESLRLYHSDGSVDARLWNNLCQIEVLYDKQLIGQCRKLIQKTRQIAGQYGKHRILQEIITWEERLLVETIASEKNEEEIRALYEENLRQNELARNVTVLRQLLNDTVKFFRKGGLLRTREGMEQLKELMKHPLLQDEKKLGTYHERYHFLSIWGMYYMLISDWKSSYVFRKKHLELIEAHPHHIADSPRLYISALNSYILCCEYTHRADELERTFGKVRAMLNDPVYANKHAVRFRLLGCCGSVLHYYIHSGEYKKGVELFEQIEGAFGRLNPDISKSAEMSFYYTFAYIYFGAGDLRKSLFWLNKIINDTEAGVRDDILVSARLFNLILHYELGNESLIEYNVKSTYRYLLARNRLFRIETILLEFIRKKMPRSGSKKEMLDAFRELKGQIEALTADPFERKALEYFDYVSWLEGKISGTPFAEVMKRKYHSTR
ncbi:MAG: hypothetical protein AB1458_08845 [Bacteroidota bacterium]